MLYINSLDPKRMSYSIEILDELIKTTGATILGDLPKLHKEASLSFRCHCGKDDTKRFVRAKISGLLCKVCTVKNTKDKAAKTNLERYGNTCTLQSKEIADKAKKTMMDRFGCDNPFKIPEIQASIKKTNIKKYGAENPFASGAIIKKIRKTCKDKYGTEFPMKSKTVSDKTKATNLEKYGVEVSSKAESVKEKAKETNMLIYGSPHHAIPEILEKAKLTNMKKYGVKHSFQSEDVKDKTKETMMERYGVEHNMKMESCKAKVRATNQLKYGADHVLQTQGGKDKQKATNIARYGFENPNQSAAIQAKSQKTGLRYKIYTTPSGIERKIQGYEHFALDILFKEMKLTEDDVYTDRSSVPRVCYNDNKRYYFPDIWIQSLNKLIEVKSSWIYKLHKELNDKKREASIKAGYAFEFWIFDRRGQRTVI